MFAADYMVVDGNGDWVAGGSATHDHARRIAQNRAIDRNAPVYLFWDYDPERDGEEYSGEKFTPRKDS